MLVFGAVVHSAGESVQATVMVCVLGLWGYLRLHWAGALFKTQEGKEFVQGHLYHSQSILIGWKVWINFQ